MPLILYMHDVIEFLCPYILHVAVAHITYKCWLQSAIRNKAHVSGLRISRYAVTHNARARVDDTSNTNERLLALASFRGQKKKSQKYKEH